MDSVLVPFTQAVYLEYKSITQTNIVYTFISTPMYYVDTPMIEWWPSIIFKFSLVILIAYNKYLRAIHNISKITVLNLV